MPFLPQIPDPFVLLSPFFYFAGTRERARFAFDGIVHCPLVAEGTVDDRRVRAFRRAQGV